jgi:hypothetical protein
MKYFTILLLIVIAFIACNKQDSEPTNPFGIDFSAYENANKANGFIIYQNYGGPRIDLAVDSSYLLELNEAGYYQMCYFFTNNDSLKITIQKFTADFNYHSDAEPQENKITLSVFNNQTINMDQCAISIQPQQETNTLNTVLNMSTSDEKGTFNGTVNGAVLVHKVNLLGKK